MPGWLGRLPTGHLLELPRRERAVLEQLVVSAGSIVPREKLADRVFGLDEDVGPNALEVYIGRLRKKLAAGGPQIRTVRGLGYMLDRSGVRGGRRSRGSPKPSASMSSSGSTDCSATRHNREPASDCRSSEL